MKSKFLRPDFAEFKPKYRLLCPLCNAEKLINKIPPDKINHLKMIEIKEITLQQN